MRARLMVAVAALGAPAGDALRAQEPLRSVTLAEALERAVQLDPDYVRALGQVDNAEWGRRAARLAFVIPAVSAQLDATRYSTEFFNIGTGQLQTSAVNATLSASYELFRWRKVTDLSATRAELEGAQATELDQRFRTAFLVESDFYGVLANEALARVARERLRRAEEQLAVARARVVSGAAVQSDSLQLVLEVTRARIDLARQETALRVARFQLGRRIGEDGPVQAVLTDTMLPDTLPLTLPEAVGEALRQGPQYRAARANERRAAAILSGRRGEYLPSVELSGSNLTFDSKFFPSARNVSAVTLTVTLPLWTLGRREIELSQARVERDVARAIREDLERGVRRDVVEAYDTFQTARLSVDLAAAGVVAARENFRVQEARYRAGATTVLDLADAQTSLTQAEADLVQAQYATRLALAGLEAILGRRLFPK